MDALPPCPHCAERDPESRIWKADRWECLNCGGVWTPLSGSQITSVDELIEVLRTPDGGLARLAHLVTSGELRDYLETRRFLEWGFRQQLGALLERLRERPALALFALRYMLTDDPLELVPGVGILAPEEIIPLVAAGAPGREAVLRALRRMIADGRLDEWLRSFAIEVGEGAVEAMEAARRAYPNEMDLPLHALLWSVAPDLGFPVDDRWIQTPKDLAAWIDRDGAHRERGLALLETGWIPTWLTSTGRLEVGRELAPLTATGPTPGARAETLLWLLDPGLPAPQVAVDPARPTLRLMRRDQEATLTLALRSVGRGHAWGDVDLEGAVPGIEVLTRTFDGTPAQILVRVTRAALRGSAPRALALVVRVRGPREDQILRVPVRIRVQGPVGDRAGSSAAGRIASEGRLRGSASFGSLPSIVGAASGGVIGAAIGAVAGALLFAVAAVVLLIPMIFVGIFFSESAVDATMDVVARLAVYGCIAIGVALGGSFGASPSPNGHGKEIVMALIASVLIGVGIANFDLVKSFLLEGSFAGEEALAKRAKAQRALSLGCSTKDNLIDKDVDEAGTEITLCPQSGVIFLFGKYRHSLAFEFSPDFKRENKDILKKFPLSRFARIDAPMTFPGSIAYSWRLLPIVSNPEAGFVSAFEATGLEFVKITARSIRH